MAAQIQGLQLGEKQFSLILSVYFTENTARFEKVALAYNSIYKRSGNSKDTNTRISTVVKKMVKGDKMRIAVKRFLWLAFYEALAESGEEKFLWALPKAAHIVSGEQLLIVGRIRKSANSENEETEINKFILDKCGLKNDPTRIALVKKYAYFESNNN